MISSLNKYDGKCVGGGLEEIHLGKTLEKYTIPFDLLVGSK